MEKKRILFATTNPTKLARVSELLRHLPLEILSLEDVNSYSQVTEDGKTPEDNARKKVEYHYSEIGMPTIAVDSGLYIDLFPKDKQPGLFVRRIFGTGNDVTDEEMLSYYKQELDKVGGTSKGVWITAVALKTSPDNIISKTFESETMFTSQASDVQTPGEPLNSLQINPITGEYYSEMTPEGDFPRIAEPTVESLTEPSRTVIDEKADLGFAFDPDGDRLALVDENGRIIGEDYTVALAIDYILSVRPGPAVVNLSTSRLAEDAAAKHGCRLYRSPVGEVNVVEEMEKRGAITGGEGNGGVIDRAFHAGRDSGVAMACAISLLRQNPDSSIGRWADSYPSYTMFKKKLPLSTGFDSLRARLLAQYGPADDTRDGLWYGRDGGWMHIRPSGTEPVVRFIAENRDISYIKKDFLIFREAMENVCVE